MANAERTLLLIGIGAGDPQHLTLEAIAALNRCDCFFIFDKGGAQDELIQLRESICRQHIASDHAYRMVVLPNPTRPRVPHGREQEDEYRQVVAKWHAQRRALVHAAIAAALTPGETGAFLIWGDPALYDSLLRLIKPLCHEKDQPIALEIIPGISSIQMLCARHQIPLNQVGESVLITTGRKLQALIEKDEHSLPATTVVMLDGHCVFQQLQCLDPQLYWGANLGTPHQTLMQGRVSAIAAHVIETRQQLRQHSGWVMDVYLLCR